MWPWGVRVRVRDLMDVDEKEVGKTIIMIRTDETDIVTGRT